MSTIYMVSGNNLFGQWLLNVPILEKFEKVINTHSPNHEFDDFNTKDLKLMHMSWSYNIFQSQNKLYVSGAWDNNEKVVKRLNIYCENEFKDSDILVSGNDDFFYIVDTKRLKIWIMSNEFDKMSTFNLLDLEFNSLGKVEKDNNHVKVVKMIVSNKSVYFLTNDGCVFMGMPPQYLDTRHCLGKVCDIACGYEHCILLTDFGLIYTWGSGK